MVAQIGNSRRCDCMNKALFDCVNKVLFDCANSSKRLTPLWHFAMIWLDSLLTFAGKVRRSKSTTRISHSVGPEEPWILRVSSYDDDVRGGMPSQTSMLTNSQSRGDLLVSSSESSLALLRVIMYMPSDVTVVSPKVLKI